MTKAKKGFEIFYDNTKNILTLRINGYWDVKSGENFEREFQEQVKKVNATGKGWYLLLDLVKCPPQPQNIQDIVSRAMRFARKKGMKNKAVLASRSIPVFYATQNFSPDPGLEIDFYFQSENDAIRWLSQ